MNREESQGRFLNPLTLLEARAGELRALGARRIGVFGSMARGEETPESDVDIYLEFAEGMRTYDNFDSLHELLETLFGRPVDLVTDGSLSERKSRLILPTVRYAALDGRQPAPGGGPPSMLFQAAGDSPGSPCRPANSEKVYRS